MTKKHLATGLLAMLLVTTCAQFSAAQSGRGRQLRIAERLASQTSVTESVPGDPRPVAGAVSETRSQRRGNINNSGNARLIYRGDSAEHHPNRADKKAGWILLGVFAVWIGAEIANDGEFWRAR